MADQRPSRPAVVIASQNNRYSTSLIQRICCAFTRSSACHLISTLLVCGMCYVAVFSSLDEALYNIRAAQKAVAQVASEPSAKQSVDYNKILNDLKKIEITLINSGK